MTHLFHSDSLRCHICPITVFVVIVVCMSNSVRRIMGLCMVDEDTVEI